MEGREGLTAAGVVDGDDQMVAASHKVGRSRGDDGGARAGVLPPPAEARVAGPATCV